MSKTEQPGSPSSLQRKNEVQITPRHYFAVFLAFAIIVFLAYQVFLSERFECDSYAHFGMTQLKTAMLHLGGYRFVPAIFMWLYSLAGVLDIEAQLFNSALHLVCLSLSSTLLFLAFMKKFGSVSWAKLLLLAVSVTLFYVNPFIAALALFPETGAFIGVGFVFVTLAAIFASRKITVLNAILSFVFLSFALGTYQPFIGFFAFAAFSLMLAEHGLHLSKQTFFHSFYLILLLAFGSVANILLGKALCGLFGAALNNRASDFSLQVIFSNIKYILEQQSSVWNGLQHTTPRLLGFAVVALLLIGIAVFFCARSVKKILAKELRLGGFIRDILFSIAVLVFCYASVFAPFVVASTVFLPARAILSLFGLFLLLAVMLASVTESRVAHLAASATVGVLLLFCLLGVTRMAVEQHMVNALDGEYVNQVSAKIDAYELATGEQITKIAMKNDLHPTYGYASVERYCAPYKTMMNSARITDWSQVMLIKVISGRDLKRVSMPEDILTEHFAGKDWDSFVPEEQMVFEGDTLYVVTY